MVRRITMASDNLSSNGQNPVVCWKRLHAVVGSFLAFLLLLFAPRTLVFLGWADDGLRWMVVMALRMSGWLAQLAAVQRRDQERQSSVFRAPNRPRDQVPFLHSSALENATYEVLLVLEAQPVLVALNLEIRVNVRGINQSSLPRKVIRILVWSVSVSWCIFRW